MKQVTNKTNKRGFSVYIFIKKTSLANMACFFFRLTVTCKVRGDVHFTKPNEPEISSFPPLMDHVSAATFPPQFVVIFVYHADHEEIHCEHNRVFFFLSFRFQRYKEKLYQSWA